jgi:hypothetical protein
LNGRLTRQGAHAVDQGWPRRDLIGEILRHAADRICRLFNAALGASRLRLMRQALTESLVLSAIGGAVGCALAWALLRVFIAIAPAALPRLEEATIDGRVLLFTFGAALASGLFFGIAPAYAVGSLLSRRYCTVRFGGRAPHS